MNNILTKNEPCNLGGFRAPWADDRQFLYWNDLFPLWIKWGGSARYRWAKSQRFAVTLTCGDGFLPSPKYGPYFLFHLSSLSTCLSDPLHTSDGWSIVALLMSLTANYSFSVTGVAWSRLDQAIRCLSWVRKPGQSIPHLDNPDHKYFVSL